MDKEAVIAASMELIAYAGEANACFHEAVASARKGDFAGAEGLIARGEKAIADAHKGQIDLLACEGKGDDLAFSLLLVHAQDHLMGAMMFESVAKEFVALYRDGIPARPADEARS